MGQEWFYAVGGSQVGPVEFSILQQLASSGQLTPDDLVWCDGMAEWTAASQVPGIMPAASAYPSAPAQPTIIPGYASPLNYYASTKLPAYAGWGWRLLALIIDSFVLFVPSAILMSAIFGFGSFSAPARDDQQQMVNMFNLIAGWLYMSLMESSVHQGSLGKMAVGIKVTDLNGNRISFGRASGRYFGKILSYLICCVGFLMPLWTRQEQGLHDMMAGTLVLKK
jgi:uncharacterized RDD family membrane protein YckC